MVMFRFHYKALILSYSHGRQNSKWSLSFPPHGVDNTPSPWPNQCIKGTELFLEKKKKKDSKCEKDSMPQRFLFLSLKVEGPCDKKWGFPLGVETEPWQIRRKGTGTSILRPQGIEFCHNYISLEDSTCWMTMADTLVLVLVRLGAENTVTSLPDLDKHKQWVNKWVLF